MQGLRDMAQRRRGGSDFPDDIDAWNLEHAAQRRGEPLEKTRRDFLTARQELLEFLSGFTDEALASPALTDVEDFDHYYFWFSTCFGHDYEHLAVLQETLASAG